MSASSTHSSPATARTGSPPFLAFVLPLLGFLLFGLFTLWLIRDLGSVPSEGEKRAAEREEILSKLRADEAAQSDYAWVDSSKKIVRIPIEIAMRAVLPELQNKHVGPAYMIGCAPGSAPTPTPSGTTTPAPAPPPQEKK